VSSVCVRVCVEEEGMGEGRLKWCAFLFLLVGSAVCVCVCVGG
jgi:hypothetical protein